MISVSIQKIEMPDDAGTMELFLCENGTYMIERIAARSKIRNRAYLYEDVNEKGTSLLRPINCEVGSRILDRILEGVPYASAFLFKHNEHSVEINMGVTEKEHKYTSTGIKFWRHQEQMLAYREDNPNSIISTHISPEGACNLKCG